jgi:PKD repeat protein
MTIVSPLSSTARRAVMSALALLVGALSVLAMAGPAAAIPNNTGTNGEPNPPFNPPPVARFTISPNPALVSEIGPIRALRAGPGIEGIQLGTVAFDGSTSSDNVRVAKYEWDLDGNGTYETSSTTRSKTSRRYTTPGTYTIRLRVTDNQGAKGVTSHQLIVHRRPVARVAASAPVALIGDTIAYSGAGSTDDQGIVRYEWDLDGDGTFETNTNSSQTASRSYGSIGKRTVRLRVTDVYGAQGTAAVDVLIHRAPTAAFTFAPSPAFAGEAVTFDASGSSDDEGIAKYEWDLNGDGTFETNGAASPTTTTTFAQPGTVTVRLKVTDGRGVSDVSTRTVTVQTRPPAPPKDTTAPRVRILTGAAKMSRAGIVAVRISCPATERTCSGALALRSLGARASALGGKSFRLGGGQSATLRIKLSRASQRLVKRSRTVRTLATARAKDAAGNAGTSTRRVTVKR